MTAGLLRSDPIIRNYGRTRTSSKFELRALYNFRKSNERAGRSGPAAPLLCSIGISTINHFQEFFRQRPTPKVDLRSIESAQVGLDLELFIPIIPR